jgi:hypothetical protein
VFPAAALAVSVVYSFTSIVEETVKGPFFPLCPYMPEEKNNMENTHEK